MKQTMQSDEIVKPNRATRRGAMRVGAVLVTSLLLAAGCGNRVEGDNADGGLGGTTTVASGSTTGGNGTFGTMDVPCGPGDAKGATDVGVTDSAIKIGVISDKDAGAIRVPTAGIEASMVAFVDYCNGLGGINGRKLELKKYDSKLNKALEATKQACDDGMFALVGSGSVLDAPEAQAMIDCDMVAVPAYTATHSLSLSPNIVAPVPNPGDKYPTWPSKFIAERFPDAIKKSAIFYPQIAASAAQGERATQVREKFGYKFVTRINYPMLQGDWKPSIQAMKNQGVEYLTGVDTVNSAISMLQAMKDADFRPEVIDLGQQYYDPTLAESGVAEGVLVLTNTQPFEEPNDAINKYVELLHKADAKVPPTTLGLQAFSAGMLFATAAKKLDSNLTRKGLLETLRGVHEWNAGGLHPTQDPGNNTPNVCMLYLKIENKKFVRYYPEAPSTDPDKGFACLKDGWMKVSGDWGAVPKAKN